MLPCPICPMRYKIMEIQSCVKWRKVFVHTILHNFRSSSIVRSRVWESFFSRSPIVICYAACMILWFVQAWRVGKSSWFYFSQFLDVEAPFLKPFCNNWVSFGENTLALCCDYQSLYGEGSGLCGMYYAMRWAIHEAIIDLKKAPHEDIFTRW